MATVPTIPPHPMTPYLCVHDGVAALDWYKDALGTIETERCTGDNGRIGHAELRIGTAAIFLSDEYPEIDVKSPSTLGGSGFALHLRVADCEYTYQRALDAGTTGLKPPAEGPNGDRMATIRDPFGHRWMLAQPADERAGEQTAGSAPGFAVTGRTPSEPGYITMHTPDVAKAAHFFGEVFGWTLEAEQETVLRLHVGEESVSGYRSPRPDVFVDELPGDRPDVEVR